MKMKSTLAKSNHLRMQSDPAQITSGVFIKRILFGMAVLTTLSNAETLPLTSAQVEKRNDAKIDLSGVGHGSFRLRFDDPSWHSGVRILPPEGRTYWDFSSGRVLSADIENLSPDKQLRLTMHISSGSRENRNAKEVNTGIAVNPGETRTMKLLIPHQNYFSTPEGVPGPKTVDSRAIHSIDIHMQWPFEQEINGLVDARISNLRLTGRPQSPLGVSMENFLPFIDEYGQYHHTEWPEKIRSSEDLIQAHEQELAELRVSPRPPGWNEYGGWAHGPKLEATGHFRVEKHEGKWYFIDPSGRLFFSHGIDVLRSHTDATPVGENRDWFAFDVSGQRELPFTHWNLMKKYQSPDYQQAFYSVLTRRLQHWGMNTIGNWGHSDLMDMGATPYTLQLTDYDRSLPRIEGSNLKFYDVFDSRYIRAMRSLVANAAEKDPLVLKSLTDPMCIGYFIDNELNYGNRGRQIFTDHVLQSPPNQAAKQEFITDLKVEYVTIDRLNESWETSYADWHTLLESREVPESRGYRADSHIFFVKAVDQYFRLGREAIKSVAPHRLYLGARFIGTDAVRRVLFEASAKYCDVLTVNIYSHSCANLWKGDFPDMPVLIGEFHFGVMDRGMFSPGLAPAGLNQRERALAYTRFLQGALLNPNIVGTHWFQFRDQPLTGRWDGEGYAIGFVDVADTPYAELIRAAREIGERMYPFRANGAFTPASE